jgi:hypothetical protein
MKRNLRLLTGMAVAATLLALSSCAYDPYYSSSATYSSGYGHGYGYGGNSFSTSLLISTGDSRWGYDPYSYSYYDYRRRAYYDPYLYGYYPVGYRPPIVYGVPHPYGWRPGSGYIRPPSRITNVTVVNYRDRESAYRRTNYGWARQVRQGAVSSGRPEIQRPYQGGSYQETGRPSTRPSAQQRPYYSRPEPSSRPVIREESFRPDRQEKVRPSMRTNRTVSLQETSQPQESIARLGRPEVAPREEAERSNLARPQRDAMPRMERESVRESRGNNRQERTAEAAAEGAPNSGRGRRF